MTFYVGQRIVCVDDENVCREPLPGFTYRSAVLGLKKGDVYTVREVGFINWDGNNNCVRLAEVTWRDRDAGYHSSRFRPLEEKPDAIEVFRSICAGGDIRPGGDGLDVRVPADLESAGCGGIK